MLDEYALLTREENEQILLEIVTRIGSDLHHGFLLHYDSVLGHANGSDLFLLLLFFVFYNHKKAYPVYDITYALHDGVWT